MLVSNGDGQVYLQKRAPSKDINPNCWDSSAAGHVDSGESYLDAAVRELSEELGILVPTSDLNAFFTRRPCASNGFEHQRIYSVCTRQTLTPCIDEIAEGKWLSIEEIDAWVATDDKALTRDLKTLWPVYRANVIQS